jgi:UTP-glucose-1-phosphate uridylyltransferase
LKRLKLFITGKSHDFGSKQAYMKANDGHGLRHADLA